jgi:ubiquitin-protein ligase
MSAKLDKRSRAIIANYKKWTSTRHPNMDIIINESNINIWYVRIRDLPEQFTGGEYIVEMAVPERYPGDPPKFYFRTKNGVYDVNKEVCISVGHMHKDEYACAGGLGAFAVNLLNGMICWESLGPGVNILHEAFQTGDDRTRALLLPKIVAKQHEYAARSLEFNFKKYPELVEKFNTLPLNIAYETLDTLPIADNVRKIAKRWITS